jgi:hypothetical protein
MIFSLIMKYVIDIHSQEIRAFAVSLKTIPQGDRSLMELKLWPPQNSDLICCDNHDRAIHRIKTRIVQFRFIRAQG